MEFLKLDGMMTQKNTEGQDLNESLVTSGRAFRIVDGQWQVGNRQVKHRQKSRDGDAGGKFGELPPLCLYAGELPIRSLFAGKGLSGIGS